MKAYGNAAHPRPPAVEAADGESSATRRACQAVVDFFTRDLTAAYIAVNRHVPDDRGDCTGCGRTDHGRAVRWPCLSASSARLAIEATIPTQRDGPPA